MPIVSPLHRCNFFHSMLGERCVPFFPGHEAAWVLSASDEKFRSSWPDRVGFHSPVQTDVAAKSRPSTFFPCPAAILENRYYRPENFSCALVPITILSALCTLTVVIRMTGEVAATLVARKDDQKPLLEVTAERHFHTRNNYQTLRSSPSSYKLVDVFFSK